MLDSDIDLMVGASKDSVIMVEGEMKEISETEMIDAIKYAHEAIKEQCDAQMKLLNQIVPLREVSSSKVLSLKELLERDISNIFSPIQ